MTTSALLNKKLITPSGNVLGHVLDITLKREEGEKTFGEISIFALQYGTKNILQRFGYKKNNAKSIPWKNVIKVEEDKIIVKEKSS